MCLIMGTYSVKGKLEIVMKMREKFPSSRKTHFLFKAMINSEQKICTRRGARSSAGKGKPTLDSLFIYKLPPRTINYYSAFLLEA
jgi:hypothetical protein